MWNTELSVSLGIWTKNLGSAQSTCEDNSWSLWRVPPVRVWCGVMLAKDFTFPFGRARRACSEKEVLGWVSVFVPQHSTAAAIWWLLCLCAGTELVQSWFLISALQGGCSESDTKLWRTRAFCGEGCLETSVSVPRFLILFLAQT